MSVRTARLSIPPARSRRARTRSVSTASWLGTPTSRPTTWPQSSPSSATRARRASCTYCRTCTAPTGSSSRDCAECRSPRHDQRAEHRPGPALPLLRRALAARHEPAGPLPLRELPTPLRALVRLPRLRRPLHDRAHVIDARREVPQLWGVDDSANLSRLSTNYRTLTVAFA